MPTSIEVRARVAVQYAVKTGKLKPQPCQDCGAARAEAHHSDYSRPLDVTWLCKSHHWERHRTPRVAPLGPPVKSDRWSTVKEAAAVLKMTPRAVEYHITEGHLKGQWINARMWLIETSEVERFSAELAASEKKRPGRRPVAKDEPPI